MNRKTTKKVDESTLTTLCAVCRGAFLDAKGVRLRRADPRQLVKDVCTYCQTRYMGLTTTFSPLSVNRK